MNYSLGVTFVQLFGFNTHRLLTIGGRVIVLMALFYLGPLVTFMTYATTLVGHHIEIDGALSIREKPESFTKILYELGRR
jgi:hypothetical protein